MAKIIHWVIVVVFFSFAAVQYNDPDPLLWMLIYGGVGLVALVKIYFRQVNFRPLILTLVVIFILYAFLYVPDFIEFMKQANKMDLVGKMKAEDQWIEGTRELGGLILAIGALLYLKRSNIV